MDELNPLAPRNPIQQVLAANAEEETTEQPYIEGAEAIPLPSKGVFYTWNPKFWNIESLYIRQLNYTDEDILTTKQYFENGTVFNELLKNVIVDVNEFPSTGLVPVDRDTILLWLRTTAFGKDYDITYNCPSCQNPIKVSWDISTLDIPKYPEGVYEELKENGEFSVVTPLRELVVKITVPTISKSLEAEKRITAKKTAKKTNQDFYGTGSLLLIIAGIEVDGRIIRDKTQIQAHLDKISFPISDARYLKQQAEKLSLKYDTAQNVICPNCNHISEGVELPIINPNFFWPDYNL